MRIVKKRNEKKRNSIGQSFSESLMKTDNKPMADRKQEFRDDFL